MLAYNNEPDAQSVVIGRPALPKQFLICDFCFWSASALSIRRSDIMECPRCSRLLSRIPLAKEEIYLFNYSPARGVELEFH
jgi:uncharacterized paraquat-inducible protein A